jgi:AraC family transcriptional regulator, regulatory protein of adaptative response / DNA-3-methyladenine glycosylase II
MGTNHSDTVPDPQTCEQARLSRDPRFDGLFFTAVTSTRIYCRSVCPVPTVKRENVRYYPSAAAAENAGFRPCLRCRPELAPSAWRRGDALVARALKLIDDGFLADHRVADMAARLNVGERQLRRLFIEHLGVPPHRVHRTRRLLFAKQLLTETELPISQVALESGFGSLRRFNASFCEAYRLAPRELRRKPEKSIGDMLTLRLDFRPPYDFQAQLEFLRTCALPAVEATDSAFYSRTFGLPHESGWFRLSPSPEHGAALRLQLQCQQPAQIQRIVSRVRRMFDLDAEPETISLALSVDPELRPLIERRPGLRLPVGWDEFETAVFAVLRQHLGDDDSRVMCGRLIERFGHRLETPFAPGLERLFPTPTALVDADLNDIKIGQIAGRTLRTMCRALLNGDIDFKVERPLDDFIELWESLPGISRETANYIALRGLGHPDSFPGSEKASSPDWRPWRGYAWVHLKSSPITSV